MKTEKPRFNASDAVKKAKEAAKRTVKGAYDKSHDAADAVKQAGESAVNTAKATYNKSVEAVVEKIDQNGDGQIDITDIIIGAMKLPWVSVDRASFLKKQFFKNHDQETIDRAISSTPALAGISKEEVDKIADEVIAYERNCVTGISVALGAPGGWAMAATIPADIVQYYGYTLRATQKLLYLYGFPEIAIAGNDLQLDDETINTIVLCMGIMNSVAGANNAVKGMAKALAVGVEKKLMRMALTKGAFYPFVKSVMRWFGVNLTKKIFAGFVRKSIPVVGGVVGGGITFISFKPCCNRLKDVLQDTMLSNPDHVSSKEENEIVTGIVNGDVIDVDFEEMEPEFDDTISEQS